MAMTSIMRRFEFCAAHTIPGHPKCGRLHGHNYLLEVTVTGRVDPSSGMLIDFAVLKDAVGTVLDAWDHRNLDEETSLHARTAEVMAECLRDQIQTALSARRAGVVVSRIVLWETRDCCAIVELEPVDVTRLAQSER